MGSLTFCFCHADDDDPLAGLLSDDDDLDDVIGNQDGGVKTFKTAAKTPVQQQQPQNGCLDVENIVTLVGILGHIRDSCFRQQAVGS